MSKQWRRRLAVVAVETEYGVAPDPATATILEVVMLDAGNPYAGNTVERERMRYGFGGFEQINTGPNVERQIRVPFSGSGQTKSKLSSSIRAMSIPAISKPSLPVADRTTSSKAAAAS